MGSDRVAKGIFYLDLPERQADDEQNQRCRLDISYPEGKSGCPVVIWFHGGGLTGGERYIPQQLMQKGYVVVGAGYRLYPAVSCETCIADAAAATAWVFRHIAEYGGDPAKVFLSGHSAGGYLVAMLGMDPRWLGAHGIRNTSLAGVAPMSGMVSTHFQLRLARGDDRKAPLIDEYAPIWHAGPEVPPLLLITGDRDQDFPGRMEENLLLARTMKIAGHKDTTMYELQGYDHGTEEAGHPLFMRWMNWHLPAEGK